jgi:hypothetical protein
MPGFKVCHFLFSFFEEEGTHRNWLGIRDFESCVGSIGWGGFGILVERWQDYAILM